jgi:hypothetical protein
MAIYFLLGLTFSCFCVFQVMIFIVEWISEGNPLMQTPKLYGEVVEIVRLIEQEEPSFARDTALEMAKTLLEDIDEQPSSLRLLRRLQEYASNANLEVIGKKAAAVIDGLTKVEKKKQLPLLGFKSLICLIIGVPAMWLLGGTLPMFLVFCLSYFQQNFTNKAQPAESAIEETKPFSTLKDFFQTTGTVGDTFGAINALFTASALAGAIYSIVLQTRELTLQREEMIMTRKELSRSAVAQGRSERSLEAQAAITGLSLSGRSP